MNTNLAWLYLYLHVSIRIFSTLFICFVLDGFLQSICFRMLCCKHSITFKNTYLLRCWFHCVEIFYIKFKFFETFAIRNSVIRISFMFFLSGFSFMDTGNSQHSREREWTIFCSTLPLRPPAHEHSDIYLQLCMWDDYHIFLIAAQFVFTSLYGLELASSIILVLQANRLTKRASRNTV